MLRISIVLGLIALVCVFIAGYMDEVLGLDEEKYLVFIFVGTLLYVFGFLLFIFHFAWPKTQKYDGNMSRTRNLFLIYYTSIVYSIGPATLYLVVSGLIIAGIINGLPLLK